MQFQQLLEFARFLNAHQIKHIEVLTNAPKGEESRYYKCWYGVSKGKFKTKDEVAKAFELKVGDRSLDRLINGTLERVMRSLVFTFSTLPENPTFLDRINHVKSQWAQIKLLADIGPKVTCTILASKLLDEAIELELYDTAFDIIRVIRRITVGHPELHKFFEKATQLLQEIEVKCNQVILAERLYLDMIYPLTKVKGYKGRFAGQAQQYVNELKPFYETNNGIQFRWYFYLIDYHASALALDFTTSLIKTQNAKSFFLVKRPDHILPLSIFSIQEICCLIHLNRINETYPLFDDLLRLVEVGTKPWFKTLETRTIASIRQGRWAEAWADIRTVRQHEAFLSIPNIDRDTWLIYFAYVVVAQRTGQYQLPPDEAVAAQKFGPQDILEGLEIARNDKEGANFTFLILELYFILLDKQVSYLESRVEAIRKYAQRNIFEDDTRARTKHFLRLLDLLGSGEHRRSQLEKKASPILLELGRSVDLVDHTYEVEPIAFETQWMWLLDLMEYAYSSEQKVAVRRISG
jgi:hypothetical protein